ncbi:MAG: HAMP domain-containing protein [Nitrospirae bacterium]|nr:HAMP domain-containing protein [Nitrospirota bacterium]
MRRLGLRYQLTWLFLLIAVVPAIGGSVYTYTVTRGGLYREAVAVMRGEAAVVADRIEDTLHTTQEEVALAAAQVALRLADAKGEEDLESVGPVLAAWGAHAPMRLDAWSVFDVQGRVRVVIREGQPAERAVSDADRALAERAAHAAAGDVVFGGLVASPRTAKPVLTYATPIMGRNGVPVGSLHGDIPVESFRRALGSSSSQAADLWVMDAEGGVVMTTAPDAQVTSVAAPSALRRTSAGDGDSVERVVVADGSVGVISRPVPVSRSGASWTVGVVVPEATIYAGTGFSRYLALIAFLAAVVVLIAYLVSVRITRPIRQLEEGTRRIARGELDLQVEIEARNELEHLAQSFHHMAYELKRAQERLIKTERLAAIGEVSSAIHHEINNPLTSVMGYAEILQQRSDLPPGVHDQLKSIYDGAVRMRDIIRKLEHVQDRTTDRLGGAKMTDLSSSSAPEPDSRARIG